MKLRLSISAIAIALSISASAGDSFLPGDSTVQGTAYSQGKEIKGSFSVNTADYANWYAPAQRFSDRFTNETGQAEKLDLEKLDSLKIGDLVYIKSPWKIKGVLSMSEDDIPMSRIAYRGPKVLSFIAFGYDRKDKVYTTYVIVKKANDDDYVNTSNAKFSLMFKKQLAKLFSDCEYVAKKAEAKEYKNTDAGLTAACRDYDEQCK
jgi:hypothetical protein